VVLTGEEVDEPKSFQALLSNLENLEEESGKKEKMVMKKGDKQHKSTYSTVSNLGMGGVS